VKARSLRSEKKIKREVLRLAPLWKGASQQRQLVSEELEGICWRFSLGAKCAQQQKA